MVRGQVATPSGMGLIGVRVSTNLPDEGFTMTRDDGWFDLMVNGGGTVMLQFGRNPYPPKRSVKVLKIFFKMKVFPTLGNKTAVIVHPESSLKNLFPLFLKKPCLFM